RTGSVTSARPTARRASLRRVVRPTRATRGPEAPRLDDDLQDVAVAAGDLQSGALLEHARIAGAELAGACARGVALSHVHLEDRHLSGARPARLDTYAPMS